MWWVVNGWQKFLGGSVEIFFPGRKNFLK